MSDLTFKFDEGLLNIRVGAIIMKDGKFLMVTNDGVDYLYTVGGRIKFGETMQQAVVREVFEETGYKMQIDRLGFIHENYFTGTAWDNKMVHEMSFIFYMKTPSDFEPHSTSYTSNGHKEKLVWVSPDDNLKYFPKFFKTELKNPSKEVKFIVTKDI